MKISFAPMEGITGYVYRNAYMRHYGGIDTFYTPFISPGSSKGFKGKEKRDVSPENNVVERIVPQVLTNSSKDFVRTVIFLYEAGYQEINLNLGCPSGTVVAKKKGAGFLEAPDKLDRFFDEVFTQLTQSCSSCRISVKTRIGLTFPSEFEDLLKIYNKYPLSNLIVHPRVRTDYYQNKPDLDCFEYALENSVNPVVYNGDINCVQDYIRLLERFPSLPEIMIGRGLLANPQLGEAIKAVTAAGSSTSSSTGASDSITSSSDSSAGVSDSITSSSDSRGTLNGTDLKRLYAFHTDLIDGYRREMNCDRDILFRMKELWTYLSRLFDNSADITKKINRINDLDDYLIAVKHLLI